MARSVTIILRISFEYPRFREGNRRGGSWIGLTSEREGGSGSLWPAADSVFGIFESRRRRRTSQSAARNVHGGRQWRAIAYISLASRCSRLLITQVQASVRGWLMDRGRVSGTAGQSYEPTYRSPISILISWACSHKGALLSPSLPAPDPMPMPDSYGTVQWKGMRLILSRFIPPSQGPLLDWNCVLKTHVHGKYGSVICGFVPFASSSLRRTIGGRNNPFPPRWTINAFNKYS